MLVNGFVIADMHDGLIDPETYYERKEKLILDKIDNMPILDFIVFCGDTLHSKQYFSSNVVIYLIRFIKNLIQRTEDKNTTIVFIEGTREHDAVQTKSIMEIFESDRFKVYTTVTKDTLCGMNVLYIPEEYVVDMDSYYEEYFNVEEKYDMIFGHGMVDKIWFSKRNDDETGMNKVTRVPVFKVEQLTSIAHYTYFGHIHTRKFYGEDNRFKYVGSFDRYEFGQEEVKGYYNVAYNTETKHAQEDFIVNDMAFVLSTKIINIVEDIPVPELNEKMNRVINESLEHCDRLRIIVNINTTLNTFNIMKDFMMQKVGNIKGVSLSIVKNMSEEEVEAIDKEISKREIMGGVIYDKSIPIEEKIATYIHNKSGKNISAEEIRQFLEMTI